MNILIISVAFPPLNLIGSTRPYSWAKYLGKRNKVTVITPKKTVLHGPLNYLVEDQNYELKEYKGIFYWIIKKFDISNKYLIKCHYIIWCFHVIFQFVRKRTEYDVIISTYSTWHCHFLGFVLKKLKYSDIWVADYRDLWNNNSHREYKYKLLKQISTFFEKLFLKESDAITTVSEPLVDELREYLNLEKTVFQCIYNGFEKQPTIRSKKDTDTIILTHTGSIYQNHRDPSLLFEAVRNLIRDKYLNRSKIKLRFVGDIIGNVVELSLKYQIEDVIELTGQVDRNKSIELQGDSDFLVLLNSGKKDSKGIMTGKIFEYISTGVPILGIGFTSENVAGKLIHDTKTGRTYTESDKIERLLHDYFVKGEVSWFEPKNELINEFRSEKQSDKLQNLLYSIKE